MKLKKIKEGGYLLLADNVRTPDLTEKDIIIDEYDNVGNHVDLSQMDLGYGNLRKVIAAFPKLNDLPLLDRAQIETLLGKVDVKKYWEQYRDERLKTMGNSHLWKKDNCKRDFIDGFNTHAEINSDNKFTLDDIHEAFMQGSTNRGLKEKGKEFLTADDYCKLKGQTEWNVEVDFYDEKDALVLYEYRGKQIINAVRIRNVRNV